jgi:hypothetical protein
MLRISIVTLITVIEILLQQTPTMIAIVLPEDVSNSATSREHDNGTRELLDRQGHGGLAADAEI